MLAPLNGDEQFLSVGTGHWTAWVRACIRGCRTPYKDLENQDGNLSAERFRLHDPRMRICMDEGWDWRVFPWQAEVAWPLLPDPCQRTLNAAHAVASRGNEVEVMVWAAEADGNTEGSFDSIVSAIQACGPGCASYLNSVCRLAMLVSGGQGAPILNFLDHLNKQYGENRTLGEDFIGALASLNISSTNKVCLVRTSLMATNSISEKVVDGIARTLTKSDVLRLHNKTLRPQVLNAEEAMERAWELGSKAIMVGCISPSKFEDCFGQFIINTTLFLLSKQPMNGTKRHYESQDEINISFVRAMNNCAGDDTIDWGDPAFGSAFPTLGQGVPTPAAPGHAGLVICKYVKDLNDPVNIFTEHGFTIGCSVAEKGCDRNERYVVKSARQK